MFTNFIQKDCILNVCIVIVYSTLLYCVYFNGLS